MSATSLAAVVARVVTVGQIAPDRERQSRPDRGRPCCVSSTTSLARVVCASVTTSSGSSMDGMEVERRGDRQPVRRPPGHGGVHRDHGLRPAISRDFGEPGLGTKPALAGGPMRKRACSSSEVISRHVDPLFPELRPRAVRHVVHAPRLRGLRIERHQRDDLGGFRSALRRAGDVAELRVRRARRGDRRPPPPPTTGPRKTRPTRPVTRTSSPAESPTRVCSTTTWECSSATSTPSSRSVPTSSR